MARSWCGFVPQNQTTKEQWSLLEASQAEVEEILSCFGHVRVSEPTEQTEEPEASLPRIQKPR